MSVRRDVIVSCDGCLTEHPGRFETKPEAKARAKADGWWLGAPIGVYNTKMDLCPSCK